VLLFTPNLTPDLKRGSWFESEPDCLYLCTSLFEPSIKVNLIATEFDTRNLSLLSNTASSCRDILLDFMELYRRLLCGERNSLGFSSRYSRDTTEKDTNDHPDNLRDRPTFLFSEAVVIAAYAQCRCSIYCKPFSLLLCRKAIY
jgi:hypothetical protein